MRVSIQQTWLEQDRLDETDPKPDMVRCVNPACGTYRWIEEIVRTVHGPMCASCAVEWVDPTLRERTRDDQPERPLNCFVEGSRS